MVSLSTCSDNAAPDGLRTGSLAVVPRFAASAGLVDVSAVRVLLSRTADGAVIRDTVIALGPADTVVDLSLTVAVRSPDETFELRLALIDAVGDTVFRGGPTVVSVSLGGDPVPIAVDLVYTGVGADAAGLTVAPRAAQALEGDTVVFVATVYDSAQAPIPGTPIAWHSADTMRARVLQRNSGRVVAGGTRGAVSIVAELLTGQRDTADLVVQPAPSSIVPDSGNGQTGIEGTMLPAHVVARVLADDGLGVEGIWVHFTVVQGGGSLWADSILTDAGGRAANDFTLGTAGVNAVEASTPALPGTVVTFVANALPASTRTFQWALPQSGQWTTPANWLPATVPGTGDTAVIAVDGAFTVQTGNAAIVVDAVTVGGASGDQTLTVSNVAGASLTVDRELVVEPSGTLDIAGTLTGLGTVTVRGTAQLPDGATLAGAAPFVVEPGGTLRFSATTVNPTISSRQVVVNGTLDCYGRAAPRQGATVTIGAGGTWAAGNACLIDAQNEPPVVNQGRLSVTGAGGAGVVGDFVNRGTVDLGLSSFSVTAPGSFQHEAGGVLQGAGFLQVTDVQGSVTLAGGIEPGTAGTVARMTVFGELPLTQTAELGVDLAGSASFDELVVSGVATLAGTLRVDVAAGFTPTAGDRFPVLTFSSRTGDFGTMVVNGLDPALAIVRQYAADTLYLAVQSAAPALPIVFAGDSGGGLSSGIFTVNPDGTNLTHVVSIPSFLLNRAVYPRWAPDRSRIAYGLEEPSGPSSQNHLFVVSADGVEQARLVSDTNTAGARWSPDGTHLAFVCYGYDAQLQRQLEDVCIVNDVTGSVSSLAGIGDGSGRVVVTNLVPNPAGRPDGTGAFAWDPTNPDRLAFVRDSTDPTGALQSSRIFTALFDGTTWNVQPLSPDVMYAGGQALRVSSLWLSWAPDGSRLAFAAEDPQFQSYVFAINRDGTGLTQLTTTADTDDDPVYSPTGSELLFTRAIVGSGFLDAWIMNADGSNQRQLTAENVGDYDITLLGYDWSPDGQEIVLTGFDTSYGNLLIYKVPRTTTAATYFGDRVLIGRGVDAGGFVRDIQPSWRP